MAFKKLTIDQVSPTDLQDALTCLATARRTIKFYPNNPEAIAFYEATKQWFRRYPIIFGREEEV